MARYNLILDYDILEQLATSCNTLAASFDDVKNAVKGTETAVQNCNGDAMNALVGQGDEIVNSIEGLGDGVGKFGEHILKYCNDMKSIIKAETKGKLQVNSVDVKWNLKQMIDDILDFEEYAKGAKSGVTVDGFGDFYASVITSEDKAKIRKVEGKLSEAKEILIAAANDIMKYEDDFEKFRKIISDFENKDDEYRDSLQEIYYEISDAGFFEKTSTKIIIGVGLIVVAAAIVFLAPVLAAIGGVVGAVAGAIAGCAWLTAIATEVLAVGMLTATFATGISVYTGEDIEDAFGGGIFDGTVSSVITGGFGQLANAPKYLSYGTKALNKTPLKNSAVAKETVEFVMSEGMEFVGEYAGAYTVDKLQGYEIDHKKMLMHTVVDRGVANTFKEVHTAVDERINIPDVELIRDGKFSLTDLKNAVRNGINNKSVDAIKAVAKQVGIQSVDNMMNNMEVPEHQEQENNIEVNPDKVTQSVVKDGMKSSIKGYVKSYTDSFTPSDVDI